MPPRKKPKLAAQAEPTPSSTNTPSGDTPSQPPNTDYDPVTDPWTDEQETALLKGIIKWKPVGIHKHFRMVAIAEYMKSQGYAPSHTEHTRIPGIWKKLGTLYNLPALNEREDSLIMDVADDGDGSRELYCPFELPEDEYGEMMFERRLAMEGSASPEHSVQGDSRRASTVADTDEPRSSPAPSSRGRKPGRGGRPAARGTRSSRLHVEVERNRKGSGTGEEDDDSEEADEDEEDGTDGGKYESEGDEDGDGDTGGSPTTRSTRAQTSRTKQKRGGATGTRRGGRRR